MQAITVLVMVDPTAPQCIINPRILDSMWLEEIDCGPDSQVVIANMRMPAEIQGRPGTSIARDGWDVSLQLQVGPPTNYDVILSLETAAALGLLQFLSTPAQTPHAPSPAPQILATPHARRPNWDGIQRGYEGERCPCCGDRIDIEYHDPRDCTKRACLYPARDTQEEAALRAIDAERRDLRTANRQQPRPQPSASAAARSAPRNLGASLNAGPPQAAFSSRPPLHNPVVQQSDLGSQQQRTEARALYPSQQHGRPAEDYPRQQPAQPDAFADLQRRLDAYEQSNSAMQLLIAEMHADMRSRGQPRYQQFGAPQFLAQGSPPAGHWGLAAHPHPAPDGMGLYPTPPDGVLGDMKAFDAFLLTFYEYRSKAQDKGRSAVPLTHCFKDMHDDLASVFTNLARRRRAHNTVDPHNDADMYTAEDVAHLDEETFIRLFRELCAGAQLDRPSQVIEALANIQQPLEEGCELQYVIRVTKSFREKLLHIPPHAKGKCTEHQIRDAFLRAIFQHDWSLSAPDYVHCATWEDAREAVIRAATDHSLTLRRRPAHMPVRQALPPSSQPPVPLRRDGDAVFEQRYNDLLGSVDSNVLELLQPESRGAPKTWESRYNELSRRVRMAREKLRAEFAGTPAPQSERAPPPPRNPEVSPAPAPNPTPEGRSGDGRTTPRPRFPDGSCYRCGRADGHRANACSQDTDIHGQPCIDRVPRSRSASREP